MAKKRKIDLKTAAKGFKNTQKVKQEKIKKSIERKKQEEEKKRKELEAKRLEEERKKEEERKREQERLKKEAEKNELKTFKLKLTTLSPIHIGDGTNYEPINYVIKDNFLYYFDEQFVLEKIYESEKRFPSENELLDLYALVAFFRSRSDFIIENNLYKNKIEVSSDIKNLYKPDFGTSKNGDDSINQMLILKHISTINPYTKKLEPYIPGSSIKGSLQTVLNLSVEESQKLKVSDTIGKSVKNQIAWSIRKKNGQKNGIPQKLEIISNNSTYEFEISKKNSLEFSYIKNLLHSFYKKADNKLFNRYRVYVKKDNQFLLRVGRYCGKNFIVKDLKNKPKTKSVFRKKEKDAKSELPFGWVLCEIIE